MPESGERSRKLQLYTSADSFNTFKGMTVTVSAYPPPLSAYRGYVDTSFNVPTGTLKLEKDEFQVTSPRFKLPSFSVPQVF